MIEPNAELLADERIARVTLAGRVWPVPRLAVEQNCEIFPLLAPRIEVFAEVVRTKSIATVTGAVLRDFASAIYWGLTRGHKGLTRAQFDDMPITAVEVMQAVHVVADQSGLFERVKATENGAARPLAVAATVPLTGTG